MLRSSAATPTEASLPTGTLYRTRVIAIISLAVASLAVLIAMNPVMLLAANTPSGGDMGAHVYPPAYLRDVLLPGGRILGWSNAWFAGFPVFYFYFPLPALTTVLLDGVLPYGVAFKLVTVAGLLAMPWATYGMLRWMGIGRTAATVGGVAGGSFVFMESFSILGGNIPSTLAGEFSFSWSMALSLLYLGLVVRAVRTRTGFGVLPGLVLGLAALSHVATTAAVVVASIPLLFRKGGRTPVLGSWALGFALTGFWAVPLIARLEFTADMGWSPLRGWQQVFPLEVWAILPLAVAGVWATMGRKIAGASLLLLGAVPLAVYALVPQSSPVLEYRLYGVVLLFVAWAAWVIYQRHDLVPLLLLTVLPVAAYLLIPQGKLYNGRFLPYWYFGLFVFAGLAVGRALPRLIRRLPQRPWTAPVSIGSAGALFLTANLVALSFIPGWATWNYSGYEGKQPWPEYQALMGTVDGLPDGRVMWEYSREQDKYGTPMALMLFPYWTDGHTSMEGLFFESSLTTPFHFLIQAEMSFRPSSPIPGLPYRTFDFERGLRHLDLYGVDYYVTYTPEAKERADAEPALERVAETEPFAVYRLPGTELVEVARFVPSVYGGDDFHTAAVDWYSNIDGLDYWLTVGGPDWWPVSESGDVPPTAPVEASGIVSNVVLENHRIAFDTTAVGVPHLVKVSYFPNWTAVGADGPYRAAPSLMVVVPTEERVEITFQATWVERVGLVLSVSGLVFVAGWLIVRRRART